MLILLVAATVLAVVVPLPSPQQIRGWADAVGPSFVLLFLFGHAVITVAPVPRTVFTLTAGLLFGPATGIGIALVATTVSAVVALLLARRWGCAAVAARLQHGVLQAVDARLRQRGWLAVVSLRLIPVAPFAFVNYGCGVSGVRLTPYVLATIVGILPGTVAVVLLGDAIAGRMSPGLLAVSICCGGVGVLGLIVDARTAVKAEP